MSYGTKIAEKIWNEVVEEGGNVDEETLAGLAFELSKYKWEFLSGLEKKDFDFNVVKDAMGICGFCWEKLTHSNDYGIYSVPLGLLNYECSDCLLGRCSEALKAKKYFRQGNFKFFNHWAKKMLERINELVLEGGE